MAGARSPFKTAADGPRIAGPGLPQSMPLPLPDATRGEDVTGTVADHREAPAPLKPQERVQETVQEKPIQGKPAQEETAQDATQDKARGSQEKAQEKIQEKVQAKAQETTQEKIKEKAQ
jgi:hypothetical protein